MFLKAKQELPLELPQLLKLPDNEFVESLLLFGGIVILVVRREIKNQAEIKPASKQFTRLFFISAFAIYFALVEGWIFIAMKSWFSVNVFHNYEQWIVRKTPPLVRKSALLDYKQQYIAYILPHVVSICAARLGMYQYVELRRSL